MASLKILRTKQWHTTCDALFVRSILSDAMFKLKRRECNVGARYFFILNVCTYLHISVGKDYRSRRGTDEQNGRQTMLTSTARYFVANLLG